MRSGWSEIRRYQSRASVPRVGEEDWLMKSSAEVISENFAERAHEDGYFAAKEHELIDNMRLEFHKA